MLDKLLSAPSEDNKNWTVFYAASSSLLLNISVSQYKLQIVIYLAYLYHADLTVWYRILFRICFLSPIFLVSMIFFGSYYTIGLGWNVTIMVCFSLSLLVRGSSTYTYKLTISRYNSCYRFFKIIHGQKADTPRPYHIINFKTSYFYLPRCTLQRWPIWYYVHCPPSFVTNSGNNLAQWP